MMTNCVGLGDPKIPSLPLASESAYEMPKCRLGLLIELEKDEVEPSLN